MISLRGFCTKGDNTRPIGNNLTIFKVFNGIKTVLGDNFDSLFQEKQFGSKASDTCNYVKDVLS